MFLSEPKQTRNEFVERHVTYAKLRQANVVWEVMKMDKNPGYPYRLFQFLRTRLPEKAPYHCSNVAAEHEGRGFFF